MQPGGPVYDNPMPESAISPPSGLRIWPLESGNPRKYLGFDKKKLSQAIYN
jgi:hypothetical protein